MNPASTSDEGLNDHGDRHVPPGATNLAVNALPGPPAWMRHRLAGVDLTAYPDPTPGVEAAAARHGLPVEHCLLTHGAAEAFGLIAYGLRPRHAACVHPSFTAPEAALRAAGIPVTRVQRSVEDDFVLDLSTIPADADLVVLGRPDNPTGRLDDLALVRALARPGRVIVVDEAFADFLPDPHQAAGLAGLGLPGLVCVRSLTKLWGLAGLRVGYLLAAPDLVSRLATVRQPWPVSTPAVHAVALACAAEQERRGRALEVEAARTEVLHDLAPLPLRIWASPANYLLLHSGHRDLRDRLLRHGLALRRGETFPGLDATYLRTAVSLDPTVRGTLVSALTSELTGSPPRRPAYPHRPRPTPDPLPPVTSPLARRTLILGGTRSGKSRHAEQLLAREPRVTYVAPGPAPDGTDDDWAARVAAHRRRRPAAWTTLETRDVAAALHGAPGAVLVDCLATWLAATMDEAGAWDSDGQHSWREQVEADVDRLLQAWMHVRVPVVAVSNEVGSGVVPGTRSGVLFRDALGRLNQRLAANTEDVRLMVAGRVHHLGEGSP